MTFHKIVIGDSRHMDEVNSESVDLIVTSPPYWNIKNYESNSQIGYGQTIQEYLEDMQNVWKECYRVLKPGTRLCINIGDQFLRSKIYGKYKVVPLHAHFISQCEQIGFDYMGSIIWQKKTTINTTGGANVMGSYPYPPNGIVEIDYEFIIILKKPGKRNDVQSQKRDTSKISKEEWKKYFSGHWKFGGERQKEHQAMFPEELPKRLIKMFSFTGDTILDPFLGSGTTMKVAKELDRNSIGYEINENFIDIIKEKIGYREHSYSEGNVFQIIINKENIEESSDVTINSRLKNFSMHKYPIDKKDISTYKVKDVNLNNTLMLEDGTEIGFIGVKIYEDKYEMAFQYLRKFVKGKNIILKYDNICSNGRGNREAYIYLKNKILINKELIKNGFADVADYDFSMKRIFLKLKN
ncbi:MAG: DNA methyltransferase [Thermoplasmata archaeon]